MIGFYGVSGGVQLDLGRRTRLRGRKEKGLKLAGLKKDISSKLRLSRIGFLERVDLHSETKR